MPYALCPISYTLWTGYEKMARREEIGSAALGVKKL